MTGSRRGQRSRRGRRLATAALLVAVLGCVLFCVSWRLDGGRWVHVDSPSMGRTAPVGSLLWIKPVPFESLEPGDFITFRAPDAADGPTYSHRVLSRNADGSISTKGDIPGPDPWSLTEDDVVGEVRMNWWGAGWLVVAAPVLVGGLCVTMAARSLLRRRWRQPATVVLAALTFAIAITVYRPLVDAQQIAFVPTEAGARATYVGTGLLPVRLSAPDESVVLEAGEVGAVDITRVDEPQTYLAELAPAVPLWWWVLIVLACFLPAVSTMVLGRPAERREAATA